MQTEIPTIANAILTATSEQIDCLWAILKYRDLGILRKIKCMAEILKFDLDKACAELPINSGGYIVDRQTRHLIHEVLLDKSKEITAKFKKNE
jgi:hypothetical protein